MLAYELYLGNKDSKANIPFRCYVRPIKKIYVKGKKIRIDAKTREQYGSEILPKYRILQEALSMPLNTSDSSRFNLPDERTSTNQPNPYVEIHGNFKRTKSECNMVLSIQTTINDRNNLLEATYDISRKSISIHADKDIRLRIDTENYQVYKKKEIKTLFEEYINNGILTKDGIFSAGLFIKIAKKFFSFVKSKWNSQDNNPVRQLNFSIYVLPSDLTIKYVGSKTDNTSTRTESFTDSFGNDVTAYASTSTTCTKFLSFYEKAFTINCKEGSDFYQNIGIGRESLPHIHLPLEQTFSISGLRWVFMDLSEILPIRFSERWVGIFSKLSENFRLLDSRGHTKREKSLLKIICVKSKQAKQEILLDENLTMDKMERLFSTLDPAEIPRWAFEVLIYKEGKITLWNDYLYGISCFLNEIRIPKSRLISSFTKILRLPGNLSEWVKQDKKGRDAIDFFNRTDFCLKTLSGRNPEETHMNVSEKFAQKESEKFAFRVGAIARLYVDFKIKFEEESKSLRDILTYSRYDREILRFIIDRVRLGLNISKTHYNSNASEDITKITEEISKIMPKYQDEIPDIEASNDFSYFFSKGYFLGGDGVD